MDKNTKHNGDKNIEAVKGTVTSESYNTYSAIRDPKKRYSIRTIVLTLVFALLIISSFFVFVNSIKTAYFNKAKETAPVESNLLRVKSEYDTNSFIKIETVTEDISEVFGIPIGVKIVEIASDSPIATGLKINDIIVKISGTKVTNINEFNSALKNLSTDDFITYTVYRNGDFQTVSPFDLDE